MPVVVLFLIFVALLVIAVPVSITLGITSVLPTAATVAGAEPEIAP